MPGPELRAQAQAAHGAGRAGAAPFPAAAQGVVASAVEEAAGGVVGGGCSGLSYKLDFDNEIKPMDQVFEDNGIKIVTDLKSFLFGIF